MREGLENEDRHTRGKSKDGHDENNKQTNNADMMKTIKEINAEYVTRYRQSTQKIRV